MVQINAGYGWEFDKGTDEKVPDGPYMTLADANAEACRLERQLNCVGAEFRVYNARTGEVLEAKSRTD